MSFSKATIQRLYRDLVKYGNSLKHTDKSYYHKYIREQFDKNRDITERSKIEFCIKVGQKIQLPKFP